MRWPFHRASMLAAAVITAAGFAACAPASSLPQRDDGVTDIVATTPILADWARQVAGKQARVTGLIPAGADPHTYEPSLRDVRAVANADIVLTNHLLLEEQALMSTVEESTRPGVPVIRVAEASESLGATLIPLVEDVTLDTPWLGARVISQDDSNEPVDIVFTEFSSDSDDGQAAAYLTGTLGQPQVYMDSSNGLSEEDRIRLPRNAHTHLSWSFSKPGHYRLGIEARSAEDAVIAKGEVTFAVAVDPGPNAITEGHWDITVDVPAQKAGVLGDEGDFVDAQVEVPARSLQRVPPDPQYRFLGRPNAEVYILPQAVLGKHVHGEIDPHTWHDVNNAKAAIRVIRDELTRVDPQGAAAYEQGASEYFERLDKLDAEVRSDIEAIDPARRHLVTTHDGYGYLAKAYGLNIAGFVSPNPAVEPSARDVIALTRALQNLKVPAVFLEPQLAGQPSTLLEVANDLGVRVCTIYGDTFTDNVTTYEELMTANAKELKECLS